MNDNIPYEREKMLNVFYAGEKLKKKSRADFVCFGKIIIELKASLFVHNEDIEQIRSYLRATQLRPGIIVNFGQKSLFYKRILNSRASLNS